jgi:predicted MFS family arabinose efflux permease
LLTGMTVSYAGDRLQDLAQAWLVATLTSSAVAVAGVSILSSIPQLLTPLGGVIGDRVNRSRLLILGQSLGAVLTLLMAVLILTKTIAIWHVYAWAFASGLIWLFSRPAYKVVLTEAVPVQEARPASALNSVSETLTILTVSTLGSLLLGSVGLPIAFMLNSFSFLTAGLVLWTLRDSRPAERHPGGFFDRQILADLQAGLEYLWGQPRLFQPLVMTFLTVLVTSPTSAGVLAAIVHAHGGSVISLGLLSAAGGAGALLGALFAGAYADGTQPSRRYALYGIGAALAVLVFAFAPIGPITAVPLAAIGFILFAEAVWNTSRVRLLADATYQTRIQALTTMAFTIGGALGQLWGGIAVDRFGPAALSSGALMLAVLCALGLFNTQPNTGRKENESR